MIPVDLSVNVKPIPERNLSLSYNVYRDILKHNQRMVLRQLIWRQNLLDFVNEHYGIQQYTRLSRGYCHYFTMKTLRVFCEERSGFRHWSQ